MSDTRFDIQRFADGGEGGESQQEQQTTPANDGSGDNAESGDQKAEIENGRKELELKEKELQRKELMLEMTKVLAERNLPVEFMEYLIADDNESTLERIKTFEKKYKAAIEAAVNEKLKGKTSPAGAGSKNSSDRGTPRVKDGFMKIIADNQVKRG